MATKTPPVRFQMWVDGEVWVDALLTKTKIDKLTKQYVKELSGHILRFKVGE